MNAMFLKIAPPTTIGLSLFKPMGVKEYEVKH
jgi:hypothetical protein